MNLIQFAYPEYLNFLVFVPVIIIIFLIMRFRKKRAWSKLGEKNLLDQLSPGVSNNKPILKMVLYCLVFSLIVTGLANPQIGTKLGDVKREGVDIIICLDVSNSMKAEDIRPNRLERSKQTIARLIDKLEDDRIGIIVFAGNAYVQLPITTDFSAAKLFLSSISTDLIPSQGTSIGSAIELSMNSFVGEDNKHKALIIITDGENHEDDAIEAARKANSAGIIIHTIGMGSPDGAPIPVFQNGVRTDYLKDNEGHTVITKLDQAGLEKIAAEGKGIYLRASNGDDGLESILKEISKMNKKTLSSKQFTDYEDRFQYFLGAGLLILLLEFIISNRKSTWIEKLNAMMKGI